MDVRQLKYFVEVAKQTSFSKAARTLHVSQPSISKMIKTLEDELGAQLLDRSGRQVLLTDAGDIVFRQAQQILHSLDNVTADLSDIMNLKTGNLVIGLPPMIGSRFFPPAIGKFKQMYPRITLKLIEVGSKDVEYGVEDGSLDVGVVALPIKNEAFSLFSFIKEPLMLVVNRKHPLAAQDSVDFTELAGESFVLFHENFTLHDRIIERCEQSGFFPKIICETTQWDLIAALVTEGVGIALLPRTLCKEVNQDRVKIIDLLGPKIFWHLAMIWKKDRYLSYATREWIRLTSNLLAKRVEDDVQKQGLC